MNETPLAAAKRHMSAAEDWSDAHDWVKAEERSWLAMAAAPIAQAEAMEKIAQTLVVISASMGER